MDGYNDTDTRDDLTVEVSEGESGPLVRLGGEIDFGNVGRLREQLLGVVETGDGDITLDLAKVGFLDSTAIGVLIQTKKRLEEYERRLTITDLDPKVRRTFELAGLVDFLDLDQPANP